MTKEEEEIEKMMIEQSNPSMMITFKYADGQISTMEFYHLWELFKDFLTKYEAQSAIHAAELIEWEANQPKSPPNPNK